MDENNPQDFIKITSNWVEQIVIGLNLCPFAKAPFSSGRIRYVLETSSDLADLMQTLAEEIKLLSQSDAQKLETTLLIHPNILRDFDDYNHALGAFNALNRSLGQEGIIQIASFHPFYQFAGTQIDDAENNTNRSPFPMVHLIREESISRAVDHYPDIEEIPNRNIEKMNDLGIEEIKEMLNRVLGYWGIGVLGYWGIGVLGVFL